MDPITGFVASILVYRLGCWVSEREKQQQQQAEQVRQMQVDAARQQAEYECWREAYWRHYQQQQHYPPPSMTPSYRV